MLPVDEISGTLQQMKAASTIDALQAAFSETIMKLGFPYFAYLRWARNDIELEQSLYTYPEAWKKRYLERDYQRIDPVFERAFIKNNAFFWSNENQPGGPMLQEFFNEAQDYGIHHGITIPLRSAAHRRAVLTMAAPISSYHPQKEAALSLMTCQIIATGFHQAAMAITNCLDLTLSPRQKEVLTLASHGLTTKEIAKLLGLTEAYICEVVNEIFQKLGTTTRISSVRRALELRLID